MSLPPRPSIAQLRRCTLSLLLLSGSGLVAVSCKDENHHPGSDEVGGAGGEAGATATTGQITGDSEAGERFLREYAASVCVMYRPCCLDEGQGYDGASCTESLYEYLHDHTEGEFQPDAAAHCLAAFDEARAQDPDRCKTVPSFDEAILRSECRAAFLRILGRPLGGGCVVAAECAGSSLGEVTCFEGNCLLQRPGGEGEGPCLLSANLAVADAAEVFTCNAGDGLYCNLDEDVCTALSDEGDACPHAGSCEDGSMCLLHVCARLPEPGEGCINTIPGTCAPGSACDQDSWICGPPIEEGEPCRWSEQCASGLCIHDECAAPEFLSRLSCSGEE